MSAGDRSIKDRVKRAARSRTPGVLQETLADWSGAWQREQDGLIRNLEQAVSLRDYDRQASITGALKEMSRKRFIALTNVLSFLRERIISNAE